MIERLFGRHYHAIWTLIAACVLMAVGLAMLMIGLPWSSAVSRDLSSAEHGISRLPAALCPWLYRRPSASIRPDEETGLFKPDRAGLARRPARC